MLNYRIEGKGYPIIFLHGFLESNSMWKYLRLLELNSKCIFIELPGHGDSPLFESLPPSIEAMCLGVQELIDHLDIKEFGIVGHSMGGYVALELKKNCNKVDKVVLLNSNTWSDAPQKVIDRQRVASIVYQAKDLFLKEAIPNLFLDAAKNQKEIDELILEAKKMTPDAIAYASLAMSTRSDFTEYVSTNSDDFYLIQGDGDKIVPREAMDKLFANKTRHYFVIEEAGHMAHIERSTKVLEILKSIFCQ
jgi:2-succinyl-6-hydroxy-2,4-cyclohexadiene-1-carboxylate synthase